jgi:iron-sulfur cluster insertion protein
MTLTLPPRVTDRAFARLAEIAELTGDARPLRVAVEGGGCSGFQYDIKLDDVGSDDLVLEKDGQKVLVDQVSLPFLSNAEIVNNPNATSGCGCGTSFSI